MATDAFGVQTTSTPATVTVTPAQASLYFIHPAHLGTPRLVTDEANALVWRNLPTTDQYLHFACHLAAQPGNQAVFITQRTDANLAELNYFLGRSPVHFLGKVLYAAFLKALQVSRVHI